MEEEIKIYDIAFDEEKNQLVYCIYDKDGNLCKYYILEDVIALQLARYVDIENDLIESLQAVKKLLKINKKREVIGNELIVKALFDFAIIKFIRCFNSSRGRKTSLDYKKVYKGNEKFIKFYLKILNLRNEEIAHSESYHNSLTLYFDSKSNSPIDMRFANGRRISGPQSVSYKKLFKLIDYCLVDVMATRENLLNKLVESFQLNGAEYYFSRSKSIDKSTIVKTVDFEGQLISTKLFK